MEVSKNKYVKLNKLHCHTFQLFKDELEVYRKPMTTAKSYISRIKPLKSPFSSISYSMKILNSEKKAKEKVDMILKNSKFDVTNPTLRSEKGLPKDDKFNHMKIMTNLPVLPINTMYKKKQMKNIYLTSANYEEETLLKNRHKLSKMVHKINKKYLNKSSSKNLNSTEINKSLDESKIYSTIRVKTTADYKLSECREEHLNKKHKTILYSKGNSLICKILGRSRDFEFDKMTKLSHIYSI